MYSQQDAEECWTNLMFAVREKAKVRGARMCVCVFEAISVCFTVHLLGHV